MVRFPVSDLDDPAIMVMAREMEGGWDGGEPT